MAALAKYRERPLWHKWDMHAVPQASQPRTRWRHAYHSRFICQSSAAQASPLFEDITSLQNTLVKHCVKVRQKKGYREEEGTVILSGSDLVEEVAEHGASIKVLFVTQGADIPGKRFPSCSQNALTCSFTSENVLFVARLVGLSSTLTSLHPQLLI